MKSLRDTANRSFLSLEDLVQLEELIIATGYMTREKALEEIERFAVELGNNESPYISITDKPESAETRIMVGIHDQGARYVMAKFAKYQ